MTPRQTSAARPHVAVIGTRGYPSYYGGFETAIRRLAPALCDAGWDVTVYGRDGAVHESDPTRDPRVVTRTTKGIESRSLSTLSYGLTAVIDAMIRKPDVALVMNVANGFWLPLLRLRGIPTLVNVDGIEWERAKWGRLAKTAFLSGAKLTARWATGLVCDAKAIAARWRRDFGVDGIFIPYGGDDTEHLPIEPGMKHRGYALAVARFVPENTVAEFFEAALEIAKTHDVVIVGSTGHGGDLDERAQALASTHSRVHWLGHLNDDRRLHSLWQHSGAYFHGHSVGGTNPALVQAMFCGAPVVARETQYNREVLDDAGSYVTPDATTIASTMLDLLRDPVRQERSSEAAAARAREHYTWDGVCDAYESALSQLIGKMPAAPARTRAETAVTR